MVKMYRKHGDDFVVDVDQVWPMIPVNDTEYQQWLALGNVPLDKESAEYKDACQAQPSLKNVPEKEARVNASTLQ